MRFRRVQTLRSRVFPFRQNCFLGRSDDDYGHPISRFPQSTLKMKPNRLLLDMRNVVVNAVLCAIAFTTAEAQERAGDEDGASLWGLTIPEPKMSGATIEDAAQQALKAFRTAHPG
jgi:hypothetical protein